MSRNSEKIYEFGPFRLEAAERRLLRDGRPVPLTAKAFDILLPLVQRSGHLVGKEELLKAVWPKIFVEESNLAQNIFTLRKALGDTSTEHKYIQTIAKRGYRFVADVKEISDKPAGQTASDARDARPGEEDRLAVQSKLPISLAVLPFTNLSSDPGAEYLSDGITESIINSLSHLPQLRVTARSTVFRHKGKEMEPQDVGSELGVSVVLTGRVLQFEERLIIRAELVGVTNGWQLWGEQYDRKPSDILAVQAEISREISESLRLKLTGEDMRRLTKRYTENSEAYQYYLRGRFFGDKYNEEGLKKAVENFQRAIELDPNYALAYAGLADTYYRLSNLYFSPEEALSKGKAAVMKALEIDDTIAEVHSAMAFIKLYYDRDWVGSEREFKRAIELSPNYATAHQRYGLYLLMLGLFDEARAELELAKEQDPLSVPIKMNMVGLFYLTRQHDQAIEQARKVLELDSNYHGGHAILGFIYALKGQYPEALAEMRKAQSLDKTSILLRFLGCIYAMSGEKRAARNVLRKLKALSKQSYVPSYNIAAIHACLDEKDEAFEWLAKAYEDRSEMLFWIKVAPELDNLRADRRFAALVRRMGLK